MSYFIIFSIFSTPHPLPPPTPMTDNVVVYRHGREPFTLAL